MTMVLLWPMALSAQNGVTVSNLNVNAGTVTFNVSWGDKPLPTLWLDSVWVFVDYNDNGTMKRLELLPGATLTNPSWSGASITQPNTQGAWVAGNARSAIAGSFSATVKLLTATADVSGACAYASNYPPVGEYVDGKIRFTGTPMYKIVFKGTGGNLFNSVSDGTYTILAGETIDSFTDKTGAPGIMKCMPPPVYTLTVSASSFCAGDAGVIFALDGTDDGRNYQLYRNSLAVVGAVLNGEGNAATFTGLFNEAGTYTALSIADELYCERVMDGTHVIVENPLPALTAATSTWRNCAGTVTLSASSPEAEIKWYASASASTHLYTGANYTTPTIQTSTTYYVQAQSPAGCLSARMAVLAEIRTEGCCQAPGATGVTFAAFEPCPTDFGATWTLTDDRDQKTYKVKYMPDGHYWMVRDLMFGDNCTKTDYTGSTSTISGKINSTGLYYGDCRVNAVDNAGYFYDWEAAMNHPLAYTGNTSYQGCSGTTTAVNSCQGICPQNWHVFTYDEYKQVVQRCGGQSAFNTNAEVNATGLVSPSGTVLVTYQAVFWTATANLAQCAVFVVWDATYWDNQTKGQGNAVRCVRNF
jgi:uncharacterized protein (TIGR02145 family)